MSVAVHHGDCLEVLRGMEEASVDAVVTDPPAGIFFMSRSWDHDKGGRDQWIAWMSEVAAECRRVIKPGGHALVWSLPRTSHWTATAWEDAGWTVRDRLAHITGQGFPKSHNISAAIDKAAGAERTEVLGVRPGHEGFEHRTDAHSAGARREGWDRPWKADPAKVAAHHLLTAPVTDAAKQWQGWGTALKPAVEDWWLFRAPLSESTVARQVLATGTGALNVDACRVGTSKDVPASPRGQQDRIYGRYGAQDGSETGHDPNIGRWPPNLLHSGDEQVLAAFARFGERKAGGAVRGGDHYREAGYEHGIGKRRATHDSRGDTGTAARFFPALGYGEDELRFFYSGKASRAERGAGNSHPTVKPAKLLNWLAKLVCPPGGTILDPFAGSGSLGVAIHGTDYKCILIEKEFEYCEIIKRRLASLEERAPEEPRQPEQLRLLDAV